MNSAKSSSSSGWSFFPIFRSLALVPFLLGAAAVAGRAAPHYEIVHEFGNPDQSADGPSARLLQSRDGLIYGVTRYGGKNNLGTIYRMNPDGSGFHVVVSMGGSLGLDTPIAPLIEGSDGMIYGTAESPKPGIYRVDRSSGQLTVLKILNLPQMYSLTAGLTEGSDGLLYGVASADVDNMSMIYRLGKDGSGFQVLKTITSTGTAPRSCRFPLVEAADGFLYGTSASGGTADTGTIYRLAKDGSSYKVLWSFSGGNTSPRYPAGGVMAGKDGRLYGFLQDGSSSLGDGAFYSITTSGTDFKSASPFNSSVLHRPTGEPVEGPDGRFYGAATVGNGNSLTFAINKDGSGLKPLGSGAYLTPSGTLLLAADGKLYGTMNRIEGLSEGLIFRIGTDGTGQQDLHLFSVSGGEGPPSQLTEGRDKWFYGLSGQKANLWPQFFRMRRDGTEFKVLREFIRTADSGGMREPEAPLAQGADGWFYTTSFFGGTKGGGALIRLSPENGTYQYVVEFSYIPGSSAPSSPYGVTVGSDGLLYGYTSQGGTGWGTLYRVAPDGSGLTILHAFANDVNQASPPFEGSDHKLYGLAPNGFYTLNLDGSGYVKKLFPASTPAITSGADLIEGSDGIFYGSQSSGSPGSANQGAIFKINRDATGLSVIKEFSANGTLPYAPSKVRDGADGLLYGVTTSGGTAGAGVFYRLQKNGAGYEVLHTFNYEPAQADGSAPGTLLRSGDGNLYGLLKQGGTYGVGGLYRYGESNEISVESPAGVPQLSGSSQLDFGTRLPGSPVEPDTVVIRNTGTLPLALSGLTIDGPAAGDFQVSALKVNVLQPGESTSLEVSFTPLRGGTRQATLHVLSDDYDEASFDIALTAVVPAPEIMVNTEATTGPEIQSGQTATLDFGETRQPQSVSRRLVISNTGGAALRISGVTVPIGFTFTLSDTTVPAGSSANLDLTLTGQPAGNFTGMVTVLNDDPDEGTFTFPVSGLVVTPEIALHNGASPDSPELTSGQTTAVDFGVIRKLSAFSRDFSIANTGSAPLLVSAVSVPAGYTVLDLPALPFTVAEGGSLAFRLRADAAETGTQAGAVVIQSDDLDEAAFTFPLTVTVVTPEIALHDGALTGTELSDGQSAPLDFGTIRKASPGNRALTIANTGTAPLLVSSVSVPAGFTALGLPTLPASVQAGAALSFQLQADAVQLGTTAGEVEIASDDLDEAVFNFPVTVTVVTPEITVRGGGVDLTAGQAGAVDFGRNIQGTPGTQEFIVGNTGTAPLLLQSITLPEGFILRQGSAALPATVAPGASVTLALSLTTLTVGTHSGTVVIQNDDLDESRFSFPISGEVFIPAPVATVPGKTTTLNRQTGLREQTIHLANDTTATVPGYRLVIRGLPVGVSVQNATERRADGSVVVLVTQTLPPHSSFDLVLEYSSATRLPSEISPDITVEVVLDPASSPLPEGSTGLAVERLLPLADGSMLLEFASRAGVRYEVQYSNDGNTWKTSPVPLQAGGNRCQWIDRGPPRTDSPPAQTGKRFYRVRELAP